jgi:hypothetical protein
LLPSSSRRSPPSTRLHGATFQKIAIFDLLLDTVVVLHVWTKQEIHKKLFENLKRKNHFGDLDIDGRIKLKQSLYFVQATQQHSHLKLEAG